MKLLRFKIADPDGYKSLANGFEIRFTSPSVNNYEFEPTILAGVNGSGKSNLLEALSIVFYHLDSIYVSNKQDYFDKTDENPNGFNPALSFVDSYELEYLISIDKMIFPELRKDIPIHITISKKKYFRPIIEWTNELEFRPESQLSWLETKAFLPKYVIGYSSGSNETLSFPFLKSRLLQFDEYLKLLEFDQFNETTSESVLHYLDEKFSQAILICNLLLNFSEKENGLNYLNLLEIEGISSFKLVIRTDLLVNIEDDSSVSESIKSKKVKLLKNLDKEGSNSFITSQIEKLKACATTWYEENNINYFTEGNDSTYLHLNYIVDQETIKAFGFHFENNSLKLFELFRILIILDLYKISEENKINIYRTKNIFLADDFNFKLEESDRVILFKNVLIRKKNIPNTILTKSLSDGEHQLAHIVGILELFKGKECLILMDEPESHFNSNWKSKFIYIIKQIISQNNKHVDILISTHSPFLVSDASQENVFIFQKDEDGSRTLLERPQFQTLGASVNKINIEIFGATNTIGDNAINKIDSLVNLYYNVGKTDEFWYLLNKSIGDSVEKKLLIDQLNKK